MVDVGFINDSAFVSQDSLVLGEQHDISGGVRTINSSNLAVSSESIINLTDYTLAGGSDNRRVELSPETTQIVNGVSTDTSPTTTTVLTDTVASDRILYKVTLRGAAASTDMAFTVRKTNASGEILYQEEGLTLNGTGDTEVVFTNRLLFNSSDVNHITIENASLLGDTPVATFIPYLILHYLPVTYRGDMTERLIPVDTTLGLNYNRYYRSNYQASVKTVTAVRCDARSVISSTGSFDIQVVNADIITTVYFEALNLSTHSGTTPLTFNVPATATAFPTSDFNVAVYAKYDFGTPVRLINVYFYEEGR